MSDAIPMSSFEREASAEGGSTWGEGSNIVFTGLLDDPDIQSLSFRESVALFEGLKFWHGPSQKELVYQGFMFEAQVDECYDFVDDLPPELKEELKHIDDELLATVNGWSRDFCYIPLTQMRRNDRSKDTMAPVLPFMKNFIKCLHSLPPRFLIQADLYRADMGVRTTWDAKVKVGRVLEFFTPLSFSTDGKVMKDFFGKSGTRTLTIIRNGIGYNIQCLSAYQRENEVVVEGITRLRMTKVEKYDDKHAMVQCEEVSGGLHHVEGAQVRGISMLTGSPVRQKEAETDGEAPSAAYPNPPVDDNKCKQHRSMTLSIWCDTCKAAICDTCAFDEHRGHDTGRVAAKFESQRAEMEGLLQAAGEGIHRLESNPDTSNTLDMIQKEASSIRIEVDAWLMRNLSEINAKKDKIEQDTKHDLEKMDKEISGKEQQIRQLQAAIVSLREKKSEINQRREEGDVNAEQQRCALETKRIELRNAIDRGASERAEYIEEWIRSNQVETRDAKQLLENARLRLAEASARPVHALRSNVELKKLVNDQKGQKTPEVPQPSALVIAENPASESILSDLQHELAKETVSLAAVKDLLEKQKTSKGNLFGQEFLTNRLQQKFPQMLVQGLNLRMRLRWTLHSTPLPNSWIKILKDGLVAEFHASTILQAGRAQGSDQVSSFKVRVLSGKAELGFTRESKFWADDGQGKWVCEATAGDIVECFFEEAAATIKFRNNGKYIVPVHKEVRSDRGGSIKPFVLFTNGFNSVYDASVEILA